MLNVMNKFIYTLLIMLCAAALPAAAQERTTATALPPEAQTALECGLSAAKQGEWELAIKYFSQAQKAAPELPVALFNLALASARDEGRDLVAITWFRAYLAAAPKAPNAQQVRAQILDLEIKVEGTIGKLIRLAKDTATHIPPDDYRKSEAYTEIAQAQAGAGDIAGAEETAAGIPDVSSKHDAYYYIYEIAWMQAKASGIAVAEKRVMARGVARAIVKGTAAWISADDHWASLAYSEIAQTQARAGDIAGAKEMAARITEDYYKSSAYSEIAQTQARAGDIVGAKETAAGIPAGSSKSSAYCYITEIAQAQYKASAEIKSWTNLAITYQKKPLLVNLGAFVESLKKELEPSEIMRPLGGDSAKGPYSIAEALAKAVRDLASALKELRDMEVKWQKLRAQSTP